MKKFKIYCDSQGNYDAVKKGWSWTAFFFLWIWAIAARLWGIGLLTIFIIILMSVVFSISGLERNFPVITESLSFLLGVIFGLYGNEWREKDLAGRGYKFKEKIEANNRKEALLLYTKGRQIYMAYKKTSVMNKNLIILGFIFVVCSTGPISFLSYKIQWIWSVISPYDIQNSRSLSSLTMFLLRISISTLIVFLFFSKIDLFERLSPEYSSFYIMLLGCTIFLSINLMSIFHLIPPIYKNTMVRSIYMIGKILLYIACARVLIGVSPIDNQSSCPTDSTRH